MSVAPFAPSHALDETASECDYIVDMRADVKMGRELEPREIVGAVQAALPGMTVVDLTPYVSERGYGILNSLLKKKGKTLYVLPNCKGVRKTPARSGEPCKPGSTRHTFEQCDNGGGRTRAGPDRG